MTDPRDSQLNRTPLYIALGLALALVLGVLIGARVIYSSVANQPVALATLDSPDAGSPECAQLIDALPAKLDGHKRAELADPAPIGAAAWASSSTERTTLRCGVTLPLQYTELSQLDRAADRSWLQVVDATPGSTMTTWYSIDTFPTVAVTSEGGPVDLDALKGALGSVREQKSTPNPIPLTALAAPKADDKQCAGFLQALPEKLGDGYVRTTVPGQPAGMAAWTKHGQEPIAVRCGVDDPAGYRPGAQLNQVDQIPWFEDTLLANGTTSGAYYALGREVNVVLSMPIAAGNGSITTLSAVIARNTTAK